METTTKRVMNARSLKNLRPAWRPGQSGNPDGGRKLPISHRMRELGEQPLPIELRVKINQRFRKPVLNADATWADALAIALYVNAITRADVGAIREIREAIEGKSPQRLDFVAQETREISIKVVQEPLRARPDRQDILYPYLLSLVRTADQPTAEAAAALAALLKGKPGV